MADDSAKEKVTADAEEKDQDTSIALGSPSPGKPSSKAGSKPNSKPGSAKSGAGGASKPGTPSKSARAKSPKSPKSGRSDKSGKKSAKKKTASAKSENDDAVHVDAELNAKIENFVMPEELPAGANSLFLSSKTQELFNISDSSETKLVRIIQKEEILSDIMKRAAVSDFSPIKKKLQDYPEDYLVVIADLDYKFGENFVIILSIEAKDALLIAPEVCDLLNPMAPTAGMGC